MPRYFLLVGWQPGERRSEATELIRFHIVATQRLLKIRRKAVKMPPVSDKRPL